MHNIKSNFDKICQTIKSLDLDVFGQDRNIPKAGLNPQFSDLEVISLSLTAAYRSPDSENWLPPPLLRLEVDLFFFALPSAKNSE